MRKTVFWGIGNICKTCLKWNDNINPDFYIDEKSECTEFNGKKVVRSMQITDWNDIFVIITVANDVEIKRCLREKGLTEGVDFVSYRDYFSQDEGIEANLANAGNIVNTQGNNHPTLFVVPLFTTRQNDKMINFFRQYIACRKEERFIIQTNLEVLSAERAEEVMGAGVITEPCICRFDSPVVDKNKELSIYKDDEPLLSKDETEWIKGLESRKLSDENDEKLSRVLYDYTKRLIDIINPKCIIIWGGWRRYSYILSRVAEIRGIPHGFMEYGWLPGTFQFDPCGIAGQGKCATISKKCDVDTVTSMEYEYIKNIFKYITDNKLDTMNFRKNEHEMKLVDGDNNHRLVTFIGMSTTGTGIQPGSEYWKKYMSETFDSVEEAVEYAAKICSRNNIKMVFKPHPDMLIKQSFMDVLNTYEVIIVKDISIDYLIEASDVVVSMASAVDYKVLMYGKPLIKVGQTGMNEKGCTYEVKQSEQFEDNLLSAIANGQTDEQKYRYVCYVKELLDKYLWDDLEEKSIRYGRGINENFID